MYQKIVRQGKYARREKHVKIMQNTNKSKYIVYYARYTFLAHYLHFISLYTFTFHIFIFHPLYFLVFS